MRLLALLAKVASKPRGSPMGHATVREAATGLGAGFAELLWPTRCAVCGEPGSLLCPRCLHELPAIDNRDSCPACGCPHGWLVCTECQPAYPADGDEAGEEAPEPTRSIECARSVVSYEDGGAKLVRVYKDEGERRLADVLARLMASALDPAWRAWADAIAYVPATDSARRRRGFDHMELLARRLGEVTGIEVLDVLGRTEAQDQRSLSRDARAANARNTFFIRQTPPKDAHILLVDDVSTTGATLEAAADALLAERVSAVRTLTFARVW